MKRIRFDRWQALSDEVDALIDEWPEDKLRMVVERAQALLRRDAGRTKHARQSGPRRDAIDQAKLNVRMALAADPALKQIVAIRAQIEASEILQPGVDTERAIKYALKQGPLPRIRTK